MNNLIRKALAAKRESKHVEFKQNFDPNLPGDWCELIKDLAAIANSGGGIIVFGLDNFGTPTGESVTAIGSVDPADFANKVAKYTGLVDFEFEIHSPEKNGHKLVAFVIQPVSIPLVFQKPGTYDIGTGRQRTAFGVGTVYFRHGAKSEPGTSDDIRRVIDRQLEHIRKSWIKGIRKVVKTPHGSQIITVHPASRLSVPVLATYVRVVKDPKAIPVRLTRESSPATGAFVHEEVSEAIFDEINNVIDANRILARGRKEFFLGQPVYYRVYAERQHVRQSKEAVSFLLRNGIADFYAPALYWGVTLPEAYIVQAVADLYLYTTNRHVHYLMRIATLLGNDFSKWLYEKWREKWKGHTQPPSFYFTFKEMISKTKDTDARLVAARMSATSHVVIEGESQTVVRTILDKPDQAAALLSKACMRVFQGDNACRSVARNLDYIAYGPEIQRRAVQISKAVVKTVGERKPGDVVETRDTGM